MTELHHLNERKVPSLLRTFTSMVPKVSLQDFFPILGAPQPKIMNWSLWTPCDQMVLLTGVWPKPEFGPLEVRPWIKFLKFCHGETSDLYASGPKSFPPTFFTHFGPLGQKLRIVLFDRRATKWFIWPLCDYFPISLLLTDGATNGGLITTSLTPSATHECSVNHKWISVGWMGDYMAWS